MYTIIIISIILIIIGLIFDILMVADRDYEPGGLPLTIMFMVAFVMILFTANLIFQVMPSNQSHTVTTPKSEINKKYYITNNLKVLYESEQSLKENKYDYDVEYQNINAPKIILKTTESKDLSVGNWNPFKVITTKSTKISKVILPKDQLAGKLTKIEKSNISSTLNNKD